LTGKGKFSRSALRLIWNTIGSGRFLTSSATITEFRKDYITIHWNPTMPSFLILRLWKSLIPTRRTKKTSIRKPLL